VRSGRTIIDYLNAHLAIVVLTRCAEIMREMCEGFGAELRHEVAEHIRRHLWSEHFWSPSDVAVCCGAPL
jgi:hypothetical protein